MATLTKARRPKLPKNKLEPPSPSQESLLIVPRVPVVRVAQSDIFERTRQLEASLAAARKLEEKRFLQQAAINRVSSDEVPTVPRRSLVRRAFDFKRPKRDPSPKVSCDASQRDQEFNASNVVKLLSQRFPIQQADDQVTDAEETICNSIIGYICDVQEAQESLIYDLLDGDKENVSSDSSEDYSAEEVARSSQRFRYTRKQMEDIIKDCDLYGLPCVQHRYRKINSRNDIVRMRQYLEGSVRLAEAEVKKELFVAFEDWMNKGYHINDRDLHLEAVEIARRKNHIHFKASPHFIFRFKKKYRIVSRKITHVTTKKSFVDSERQREICEKFRNEMKSLIANHTDKGKIFNSDQTGLRLELRSGRTLAYKGSRHIQVLVQRKNALTHSLTLQPVISADGYLQTPIKNTMIRRNSYSIEYKELLKQQQENYEQSKARLATAQKIQQTTDELRDVEWEPKWMRTWTICIQRIQKKKPKSSSNKIQRALAVPGGDPANGLARRLLKVSIAPSIIE
ncbi:hypothetical protein QR680_008412 [Steinernema hermaphroditum]|uniref:HTH CENPB-type domain-containing protein n=1 Tax=Steinernema hermaphroditum TaxID=289476 RepID=A0AA39IHV4_9BILA|nr:hypothetical protein QR680_008412 [Steinernema hermaphroditum]